MILRGFCSCEQPFGSLPGLEDDVSIIQKPKRAVHKNRPVARSLGPILTVHGSPLAEFAPNPDCNESMVAGIHRRVGRKYEQRLTAQAHRELRMLARTMAHHSVHPVHEFVTPREYILEYSPWSEEVKKEVLAAYESSPHDSLGFLKTTSKDAVIIPFTKAEMYPSRKPHRLIMPQGWKMKVNYGAIFKTIELQVYKMDVFVKHVAKHELGAHIMKKMTPGAAVYQTDYTSFESCFDNRMMSIEQQFYSRIFKNYPTICSMIHDYLHRVNKLKKGPISCKLRARRMSGAMNTSLGNGIANYVLMNYLCHKSGFTITGQVYEGDDGLFCGFGTAPTEKLAKECGLLLKIEKCSAATASFCGNIFDPIARQCIKDPIHVLARFPWSMSKRRLMKDTKGLLKAKAYSLLYELPACPILTSLAETLLRNLSETRPLFENDWKTRMMKIHVREFSHLKSMTIHPRTRQLFERVFNIPIDLQLQVEGYLKSRRDLGPLSHPSIDRMILGAKTCVDVPGCLDFTREHLRVLEIGCDWRDVHDD